MIQEIPRPRVSTDRIRTVAAREFPQLVLNARGPVAVEFMSYGCVHCRAIEPVLQQVAETVKSQVTIYRVNIAVEQELAGDSDISGTPTFIMFLNGKEVGRVEGPRPTFSSVLAAVREPFQSDEAVTTRNAD